MQPPYSNLLNDLLRKEAKWKWSKECQKSFDLAKEKLTSAKVLTHYTPILPIRLAGDASAYGLGSVIAPDGSEHPVAFASCTLTTSYKRIITPKSRKKLSP